MSLVSTQSDIVFNREQLAEIAMAESRGVADSECLQHADWGPVLMNMCWNLEKEDESIAPVLAMAEWIGQNLPRVNGLLEDNSSLLFWLSRAFEQGRIPVNPVFRDDGTLDYDMYRFLLTQDGYHASGSVWMWSGRILVEKISWFYQTDVMSEGIPAAADIVSSLQAWAADDEDWPYDGSDRLSRMNAIVLILDDMNIRGYQLIYALDYVRGSVEMLYRILRGKRSQALCDYINIQSAKDYVAGDIKHHQIAVLSDASFCHGSMPLFSSTYPSLCMAAETAAELSLQFAESLSVNWSDLEIKSAVSIREAMLIMAARGFKLVRYVERKDRFDGFLPISNIIWYHPVTKDYVYADTCKPGNIIYGDVHLIMHRMFPPHGASVFAKWKCSFGGHDGQDGHWFDLTHHEGLFRVWDESMSMLPSHDFDWKKIGFDSFGVPIPVYYRLRFVRPGNLEEQVGERIACIMVRMGEHCFDSLVNRILCLYDTVIVNSCSPHYVNYEEWFYKVGVFDAVPWFVVSLADMQFIYDVVFTWLRVPSDLIKSFLANVADYFKRFDNGGNFVTDAENCSKYAHAIIDAYGLPDPSELPVRLPWLSENA